MKLYGVYNKRGRIMMNSKSEELISGLITAFIDQSSNSNLAYRPELYTTIINKGKFLFLWNKN